MIVQLTCAVGSSGNQHVCSVIKNQVLNRSMDPRNPEQPDGQLPLIASLPQQTAQVPIIPQNLITSGTRKDCIRLRNIPAGAQVTDILTFLGEYSQFIVYQGVHMVYTAQVQSLCKRTSCTGYQLFQVMIVKDNTIIF